MLEADWVAVTRALEDMLGEEVEEKDGDKARGAWAWVAPGEVLCWLDGEGRLDGVVDFEGERVVVSEGVQVKTRVVRMTLGVALGKMDVVPATTPIEGAELRVEPGVPAMEGAGEWERKWEPLTVAVAAEVPAKEGPVLAVAAGVPSIEGPGLAVEPGVPATKG